MIIEQIVKEYLDARSTITVPVYLEKPNNPPVSYILIEKTGSGLDRLIPNSTITVQCYASSMYNAASLNEVVKTAMLGSGESYDDGIAGISNNVSSCSLNSDYNATDTTTKVYRYQAVYDLVHF